MLVRYLFQGGPEMPDLRSARRASSLSIENATFALRAILPEALHCSSATVRRVEAEPEHDPVLAVALCEVYGADPRRTLPAAVVDDAGRIGSLLRRLDLPPKRGRSAA